MFPTLRSAVKVVEGRRRSAAPLTRELNVLRMTLYRQLERDHVEPLYARALRDLAREKGVDPEEAVNAAGGDSAASDGTPTAGTK